MKKLVALFLLLALVLSLGACGEKEEPVPSYDHQYLTGGYYPGALEFEEVSHKEADPNIHLQEIYIDPLSLSYGYVILNMQSEQALTFTVQVDAQHTDGSVMKGSSIEVTLAAGEPSIIELDFSGWPDGAYSLVLSTAGLPSNQTMLIQIG